MTPDRQGHVHHSWVPQMLILLVVGGLLGTILMAVVLATTGV